MNGSLKKICLTAMGVALFVVLTLCLQVPVFENYYLCLGYVAMTVYCYYFGVASGIAVGFLGVIVYCLLTSGLNGMPGWSAGNIVIGFVVGMVCRLTAKMKNRWLRQMFIGASVVISVAIGILGVKSLVETLLYSQPIILRMAKNVYAFVADALVMLISLPLCISLEKVMKNIK
jgi:uncharacterized membrane protein